MAFLRDLWNFDKDNNPSLFYGKLSSLNEFYDITKASPTILKNLQIQQLKNLYSLKGQGYTQLNNFLQELLGSSQATDDDLFARLTNGINKGLDEFRGAENKINKNWIQDKKNGIYYKELDDIIAELNLLVNQITGENGIPAPSLDRIKNAIKNHKKQDFIQAKGDFLEEIGTWIMARAGLAGFTTGAWQAEDKFFGEDFETSIIEDAMGLLKLDQQFTNNSLDNFLKVKIVGYSRMSSKNQKKANKQLQKWIDSVQELNGVQAANGEVQIGVGMSSTNDFIQWMSLINNSNPNINLSISLNTNLYEQIRQLSVNIQGKSNIERHLANKGKRSLFKIKNGIEYQQLVAFSQTDPVIKRTAVSDEEFNKQYKEFVAYANYNLSKNIKDTVYARNEFYITKEGFSDLATLMQKRGFYIRLKDSTMSYKRFLQNGFETIYD